MEVKENRPDACAASGTANSIYKDFSTDAPDIQEELTGPVLPDECAADIVSFCSEQTIAYDDLLEYATLFYRHWFMRNNPSGRCQSRKSLINDVKGIISDYEGWDYSDNPVSVPDEMYDTPEGLIGMYSVFEWEEPGYRGSNPNRSHLYRGSKRTRGLVRMGVATSEDATTTDSTNKEE